MKVLKTLLLKICRLDKFMQKILNLFKKVYVKFSLELAKLGNYKGEDDKYWKDLKNKYKGQRGFIIGNGPSLQVQDLDLLQNEITIASNRIYLLFNKTKWRPTIYTVADYILWPKIKNEVMDKVDVIHLPNYLSSRGVKNFRYWKSPLAIGGRKFSHDLSKGAYGGHTITYENIQIAAHLGLNPIYLIGCDHNYPGESKASSGIVIKQGAEQTHFSKDYRQPGEKVLPASIVNMEKSYSCAKREGEERGIAIYNATRGGHLEVFTRIKLEDLFGKEEGDEDE